MLQKELHLENFSPEDNNPFVSLSQKLEDRHKAASEFSRTVQAFETLNVDPAAVKGIWCILASIYHLGVAGVSKSKFQFLLYLHLWLFFIKFETICIYPYHILMAKCVVFAPQNI